MNVPLPFTPARPRRVWPGTHLFHRLATDPAWVAEPKKDGVRCLALADGAGQVTLVSRHERRLRLQEPAKSVGAPPDSWLDGELVSGVLWLFDVLRWAGRDVAGQSLDQRRGLLELVVADLGPARLMPRVSAAKYMSGGKDEGVIFKHRERSYPMGQTSAWIKCRR